MLGSGRMREKIKLLCLCLAVITAKAGPSRCQETDKENPIVRENRLPGSPSSEWDINGAGDPSIQGFATSISVSAGEEIHFKVKTDSTKYRADIYRMGYYSGDGARLHATVHPTVLLPLSQPECVYEFDTHLVDCGNWDVTIAWKVPTDTASGLFFARLVREDPEEIKNWRTDNSQISWDSRFNRPQDQEDPRFPPPSGKATYGVNKARRQPLLRNALKDPRASHMYFIVRQDNRTSEMLIQTMVALCFCHL